MKKYFLSAVAITMALFVSSCSDGKLSPEDVPASVTTSFNAKYPGATDVEWKTEKSDGKMVYEAEFKMGDVEKEVEFDVNGTFIREEE